MCSADVDEDRLRGAGLGTFFRPTQLREAGVNYDTLQRLVAEGIVERVARGLYRLQSTEPTENYSLAAVCARVPRSIICLLSALKVHGIGTQLPRDVWIAIPHKARVPKITGVGVRLLRFSGAAWSHGVDKTELEGVLAQITSPVRTVVDCFRFERLVGREAAVEALRAALQSGKATTEEIYRTLEVLPSKRLRYALEAGLI